MSGTDDWTRPEWVAEARAWILDRLAEHGASITGDVERPHLRWWSTVLRVPTTGDDVFLKASRPDGAFEGR